MNIQKIRKHVTGGFRPFVIRACDGREFQVPHPEFIAIGKFGIAVVDRSGDINAIDALHMVSIQTQRSRNGAVRSH